MKNMKRIKALGFLLAAALCLAACTPMPGSSLPSDGAKPEEEAMPEITEGIADEREEGEKAPEAETEAEAENEIENESGNALEAESADKPEAESADESEAAPEEAGVGTVAVSFSGSFTATVEKLLPDYCALPGNTVAVVHFFQSMPFLLRFEEDMTGKLVEGVAYVFDFAPFEVLVPETETAPAIEDYMYRIRITSFREATKNEEGMWSVLPTVAGAGSPR